ncbi:hypothetical protein [uncultured Amaricoccus sp.]|uniref:hypothetical protein n=1 Tax=uncultured Amaricoccus sp. TaxID=339341 RepID=UPI002639C15F|nr:hypothetical protein [uncultured Amaricoccus sp.]
MPTPCPAHLLALLLLPCAAFAQDPQLTVTLDPDGPVTVGTPVEVTATLLVPTFMPDPPVWPDLQIADAVTRLPGRATHPVTERIGRDTWSGVARTWQIVPQRAGDYDLGQPQVTATWADPETSQPTSSVLDLPPIAFSATVPAGAEGIDPFLAATAVTVTAALDGLPPAPKPGDAFTLTLTTTAAGPPAILLPPLASRIATPPGLRAYPREPALADGPPATRTEAIAYVIEQPGTYAFPPIALDWWNTTTESRETATTAPIQLTVAAPPGWHADREDGGPPLRAIATALLLGIGAAIAFTVSRRRPRSPRPPTEADLYRALRHAARTAPPPEIRRRLLQWQAARPDPPAIPPAVAAALRRLERSTYGPPGAESAEADARRDLLSALSAMPPTRPPSHQTPLPALNPAASA